jgi:cytochrome c oxidase subunit III
MEAGAGQPSSLGIRRDHRAATVARARQAQPSGWWGMVLFLCAEGTLFGILIATYFYLDSSSRSWPPDGIAPPSVTLPLVATAVLLATTVPVALAAHAARAGLRWRVVWLIAVAVMTQAAYLAVQVLLFRHDLRQFSPKATAYGSIYFTLLAAHHAHVVLGILLELAVLWQVVRRGLSSYWLIGVRSVALYWYVVNGLAVCVVLTQLSPSL